MRKHLISLVALLLLLPTLCGAQTTPYTINHGPYLQGLTYDGVIVCFTTSDRGFSGVVIRRKGSDEVRLCRTSKDGLFEARQHSNRPIKTTYGTLGSVPNDQ
ncbi:MAG: hypothetical protein II976_00920 [Alistipes sp.]|nr:hypothetical protein [Alistipes sp.]